MVFTDSTLSDLPKIKSKDLKLVYLWIKSQNTKQYLPVGNDVPKKVYRLNFERDSIVIDFTDVVDVYVG